MRYLHNESVKRAKEGSPAGAGRTEAQSLLQKWGGAPLMRFVLLPDKDYLLGGADEGAWGVAYRVAGRHALALGDPFGAPGAAGEAIAAFRDLCRRRGLSPTFYQVTPEYLDRYRAAGLRAVKVGEDAQIHLPEFALAGKRFKNLRNDLRRVEKAGVVLEEHGPGTVWEETAITEMAAISEGWRRAHRAREGAFAMGGFDPDSALFRESRFFVAREGKGGRMLAFATFVPIFGTGETRGWTLDLMRRRGDALHGVMDFLVVSAAQMFQAEGAEMLSLGLSPLAGAGDPAEAPALSFLRRFLFTRMGRVYNFQGLHTFKAKFATHWEARYLVSPRGIGLAATAGAVLKAHLGQNEQPRLQVGRVGRRRTMLLATLLLLMFTPFEKTLAKRAVRLPHRVVRWEQTTHWHPASHWHRKGRPLG